MSGFSEHFYQMFFGYFPQVSSVEDTHEMHLLQCFLAHAPEILYRQLGDKIERLVGMNGADAVGFAVIRSHFGEKLAVADTCRGGESGCFLDTGFDFFGNIHRQFYPFLILRYIKKGFIYGDGFDEVGIFLEYLMYLMGYFSIIIMPAGHDDEVRAALLGLSDGLRRVNAILPCLIAGCRNHTTRSVEANRYRFAPKFLIVSLLYRSKEGIHVDMYNLALCHSSLIFPKSTKKMRFHKI